MKVKSLSHVRLSVTPWTAAYQALLSMGFSRQEYWSGVPLPSPLENLEAAKTSSEEAVKKMALATGNIAVSITLLGKCFSAQYRET